MIWIIPKLLFLSMWPKSCFVHVFKFHHHSWKKVELRVSPYSSSTLQGLEKWLTNGHKFSSYADICIWMLCTLTLSDAFCLLSLSPRRELHVLSFRCDGSWFIKVADLYIPLKRNSQITFKCTHPFDMCKHMYIVLISFILTTFNVFHSIIADFIIPWWFEQNKTTSWSAIMEIKRYIQTDKDIRCLAEQVVPFLIFTNAIITICKCV